MPSHGRWMKAHPCAIEPHYPQMYPTLAATLGLCDLASDSPQTTRAAVRRLFYHTCHLRGGVLGGLPAEPKLSIEEPTITPHSTFAHKE